MVDASGEQMGSLSQRFERISPPSYRLRPLLFMIYLVRHSLWTAALWQGILGRDQNRPARCCATPCAERKFALLNRRLRSFFDRTELRERAANLISRVSHLLSRSPTRQYIHLRCFLSPFFLPFTNDSLIYYRDCRFYRIPADLNYHSPVSKIFIFQSAINRFYLWKHYSRFQVRVSTSAHAVQLLNRILREFSSRTAYIVLLTQRYSTRFHSTSFQQTSTD